MFRNRPAFAAELLAGPLGRPVPAHDKVLLGSAEVIELRPTAHRADAVILLGEPARPALALLVEVQLRADPDKTWVWPHYLATVRLQLRCPTVLMVLCLSRRTARWAATPIHFDDSGVSRVVPVVLGPDAIPVVLDPATTTPELAVLSALAHVRDDGPLEVLDVLATALSHAPVEQAVEYTRLVLAQLPDLARQYLEALMAQYLEALMATETFEYQSDFTRALEARGEARGRARILLRILSVRGIALSDQDRERIVGSSDLDQLETWAERALSATTSADLFA